MSTAFQKSQKVIAPDGKGSVEDISGDKIKVKLLSGEIKTYNADELEDGSDQG